jgi:hypothetical protein
MLQCFCKCPKIFNCSNRFGRLGIANRNRPSISERPGFVVSGSADRLNHR